MSENIYRIFPRWAQTLGAMSQGKIQVRSKCACCGIELRVDVDALSAKYGSAASLIDRVERCSLVACHGQSFFLASKSYGRAWLKLLDRRQYPSGIPASQNAETLGLIGRRAH